MKSKNLNSFILLLYLLSLFIFNTAQISAQNNNTLDTKIDELLNNSFFEKSTISIGAYDLTLNQSILNKNSKLLLHPASNMKILTSVAGLIYLGRDFEFKTELYHTGVLSGVTIYGDIYVKGRLDPVFTSAELDTFVKILEELQVKYILGDIYGDISVKDSLYHGSGWMWDDDPDPSAPYLSALNINQNCIDVFVSPSEIDSLAKVKLIPETNFAEVYNSAITSSYNSQNKFKVTRDWLNGNNKILITGKVNAGEIIDSTDYTEKINLLYPEKYFLTLFKEKLEAAGIFVDGALKINPLPENFIYLGTVSHSIDTVLYKMNKESDNLSAEMMLYALALVDSLPPASAINGSALIKRMINSLGLDSSGYKIADGSGVSRYNIVSTELILETLKDIYYKHPEEFELFYSSLALGGVDGTLEKRMKSLPLYSNVHAKTGTLNGVSSLSGYLTAKSGNLIAFSIFIQNYTSKNSEARRFLDIICENIYNHN